MNVPDDAEALVAGHARSPEAGRTREDSSVHVLIDATPLGDDSAYRGIGTYLRQLLPRLGAEPDLAVTALHRRGTRLPPEVEPVQVRRIAPGRWRRLEHELLLPLDLLRRSADVFHSPALDPPLRYGGPWVQTLHDVIPLVFEDRELAAERRRWLRHTARYRNASAIIAISHHTADIGISRLGLDRRRVEVIPHGVGPEFEPPNASRSSDRPYVLMVGEYSQRKGFAEAFALSGALAEQGYPHRLRVGGRIAPWVRPAVDALVERAPAPDRIELLDFVDDLVGEYQRADVVIMPSRYEGFGLPILEAMACGTPVVAFSNSSITEVVGDAGVLVRDGDVPAMTVAVRSLIDDRQRWQEFSRRGLERAVAMSWERSAAAHAELYRRVARDVSVR